MTKFLDGPAKGKTLMLKRAPVFLRVTNIGDRWDALDQLNDSPLPEEVVHAYRAASEVGAVHVNRGGGKGGFYTVADYELCPSQPSQDQMRNLGQWADWCAAQPIPEFLKGRVNKP